jgi:hypothetical protein
MTFKTVTHISTAKALVELHEMLTYPRYASSHYEQQFIEKFIDTLPGVEADGYGNRHVKIGDCGVLWSSHTDSVHSLKDRRQVVVKRDGKLMLKDPKSADCLGADCGTGVWLMRHMILRGVPGHYVFHREEEVGAFGAEWLAKHDNRHLLDGIYAAIALDRKGYHSVITCQGARTASDAFARSVAAQLGGDYKPDDTGLFTDTKKYRDFIPECSNISVGYFNQHSGQEVQDVVFAGELLDKLCAFDTTALTIERDPAAVEEYYPAYGGRRYSWTDHYDADMYDSTLSALDEMFPDTGNVSKGASTLDNYERLVRLVQQFPFDLADWLDREGVNEEELRRELGLDRWR